jgi:hypothetical protein
MISNCLKFSIDKLYFINIFAQIPQLRFAFTNVPNSHFPFKIRMNGLVGIGQWGKINELPANNKI